MFLSKNIENQLFSSTDNVTKSINETAAAPSSFTCYKLVGKGIHTSLSDYRCSALPQCIVHIKV